MIKRFALNLILICATFVLPWYFLYQNQKDILKMKSIQVPILTIIFLGAGVLTILNHKYRKQALENKWIWLVFELIGIAGLCYSGFILWLLYSFRHGIGF